MKAMTFPEYLEYSLDGKSSTFYESKVDAQIAELQSRLTVMETFLSLVPGATVSVDVGENA